MNLKEFLKEKGDYLPFLYVIVITLALLWLSSFLNPEEGSGNIREYVDSPELVYEFRTLTDTLAESLLRKSYWQDVNNYYVESETGEEITLLKGKTILTEIKVFDSKNLEDVMPKLGILYKFIGKYGKTYESDSFKSLITTYAITYNGEVGKIRKRDYKVIQVDHRDRIIEDSTKDVAYKLELNVSNRTGTFYTFSYKEDDVFYTFKKDAGNMCIPKDMVTVKEITTCTPEELKNNSFPIIVITDEGEVSKFESYTDWLSKVVTSGCNNYFKFPVRSVKIIKSN